LVDTAADFDAFVRSRMQAYVAELESQVTQLEEEQAELLTEQVLFSVLHSTKHAPGRNSFPYAITFHYIRYCINWSAGDRDSINHLVRAQCAPDHRDGSCGNKEKNGSANLCDDRYYCV